MSYAEWDPSLETGDELVDSQHKNLYDVVNDLERAIDQERGREALALVVVRMLLHAKTHFHDEEALMSRCGYPDLERHRALHREFEAETERLSDDYLDGHAISPGELCDFLERWLNDHIGKEDRLIVEYLDGERLRESGRG